MTMITKLAPILDEDEDLNKFHYVATHKPF